MGLLGIALRSKDSALRWQSISFDVFAALVLVGMLREATLIPASGDSLVDLLVAFVPFTMGGVCLLMSATRLRHLVLAAAR